MDLRVISSLIKLSVGDLVFFSHFSNSEGSDENDAKSKTDANRVTEEAIISCFHSGANVFHVGMVTSLALDDAGDDDARLLMLVHATSNGVRAQPLADALKEIKPDFVESKGYDTLEVGNEMSLY